MGWENQFPVFSSNEANLLEVPFTEQEIHGELMRADGNKAPDSDYFNFKFVQKFWSNLKGELVALFN